MRQLLKIVTLTSALLIGPITAPSAFAFCGVISETTEGKNIDAARTKAQGMANSVLVDSRQKYGKKFKNSPKQVSCTANSVKTKADGTKVKVPAKCTVNIPFCVNP
jgi:hypothetical protein